MRTVRRILLAIKDPQSRSQPALAKAAQLAHAFGAQLELFHAITTPLYVDIVGLGNEGLATIQRNLRARSTSQLEVIAARVRKQGLKVATAVDWDFPVYEAIVRRARRLGADLIVAECRPGHRLAPGLLHLTDWDLLRHSPVPVLMVKSSAAYRRPTVLAAVDPTHAFSKPSRLDDEILGAGVAIADALHGKLHAVHAYLPAPLGVTAVDILDADLEIRMQAKSETAARKGFARALRKVEIPAARRYLLAQHPADAIQNAARKSRSAIVVMGAISRSGLKRIFIGNTAERLLDDLPCDVLVVKPRQFHSRVPRAKRGVRLMTASTLIPF